MAQHLAALLMDKFRHMSKQTLPLAEIQKGIAPDTGMDVGPAAGGERPRPRLTTAPHLLAGRLLAQAIAAPGYHRVQPKQLGSLPLPQKPALDCAKVEVFPLSTPRHRRAARGAPVARARRLRALHAIQRHPHRLMPSAPPRCRVGRAALATPAPWPIPRGSAPFVCSCLCHCARAGTGWCTCRTYSTLRGEARCRFEC